MPYVCGSPESFENQKIGDGQCVTFVRACTGAPLAHQWTEGSTVKGNLALPKGTAIATFMDGKYENNPTGNHAAIYVGQNSDGLWVYDQWISQGCVKKRLIRFKAGVGSPSNDGDVYSVIQ